MTPTRRRRLIAVALILVGVGLASALALRAFQENILFFYDPSQVVSGEAPVDRVFRIGGMVTEGSVVHETGVLNVVFDVTDFSETVTVNYAGLLPDLFREGQGVIAIGRLNDDGVFVADEVLAKHDETYMPPEVAESLKEKHGSSTPETQ
ncbi:MAG: cytochrome c maturation protein CcmE [Gammaproteobacteria bacterium]